MHMHREGAVARASSISICVDKYRCFVGLTSIPRLFVILDIPILIASRLMRIVINSNE